MALVLADVQDLAVRGDREGAGRADGDGEVAACTAAGSRWRRATGHGSGAGTRPATASVGGGVMTHPLEHLAAYVDGTLAASERAVVDDAPALGAQVPRRGGARSGARGAPIAARSRRRPDLAASSFTPSARRRAPAPCGDPDAPWARSRRRVAAAAVVALVALVVPRLGTSLRRRRARPASMRPTRPWRRPGPLRWRVDEHRTTTWRPAGGAPPATPRTLASRSRRGSWHDARRGRRTAGATPPSAPLRRARRSAKATRCLRRAFPGSPASRSRRVSARFEGTPAYLGFVHETARRGRNRPTPCRSGCLGPRLLHPVVHLRQPQRSGMSRGIGGRSRLWEDSTP